MKDRCANVPQVAATMQVKIACELPAGHEGSHGCKPVYGWAEEWWSWGDVIDQRAEQMRTYTPQDPWEA